MSHSQDTEEPKEEGVSNPLTGVYVLKRGAMTTGYRTIMKTDSTRRKAQR
jgi:hypothetical protein